MGIESTELCGWRKTALVVGGLGLSLWMGGLYCTATVRAADDRTITDDERTEDDDKAWAGIMRRLGTLVRVTKQAGRAHDSAVGITAGQTARLSVLGRAPGADRPRPVRVRLTVFDGEGTAVGVKEGSLRAGHVVFLDVPGDELGLRGGDRLEIYGVVEVGAPENVRRLINAGLELFDSNTGVTDIVMALPTSSLTASHPRDD